MTQTNLDRLKAYADAHAQLLTDNCSINPELYQTYGVKRGLRDQKGRGVLAGLTNISEIESNKQVNGETVPCEGRLFYRGYDITELVGAEAREHRFGFEEIAYLLLFGELPTREELIGFPAHARGQPHAAHQLCARRDHEGPQPRHDELPEPQRADAGQL